MSTPDVTSSSTRSVRRWDVAARARAMLDALEHLVGGLGTAVLAFVTMFWLAFTVLACLVGVGLLLVPTTLRVLRAVANRERGRLSRWGPGIVGPGPAQTGLRAAVRDSVTRRELGWMVSHSTIGLLLGLLGVTFPLSAIRDVSYPLWRHLDSESDTIATMGLWPPHFPIGLVGVTMLGVAWIFLTLAITPGMARLQAWPGRRLLPSDSAADLALRVAQLTATRAAALDAHATELRRIERSLHDGTQNRIVAVNVLLGAARRALTRNPADAEALLDRAQNAAEHALAELRAVVRGILPPVLADRSLPDALSALATNCPVPCRVDADVPDRCAASVEATAYFVVAESLTNVARHSGARQSGVALRRRDDRLYVYIIDDGTGGADERKGSGLAGIRRRVEAHDGTFAMTSPPGGPTTLTVSLPCGL